jgi:predicted metal-dependent HD superfamily phosphohydrolase
MSGHQEVGERLLVALERVGVSGGGSAVLHDLLGRYAEPHRHYHTLEHIAACLRMLDELEVCAEHPAEVELTLWFHDAIYDPHRADNEERSAELAQAWLSRLGVEHGVSERVAASVRATSHHDPNTSDQAVVSDADLAILGSAPKDFERFERQIRLEFAHVQAGLFREGRRRILAGFLARPQIYQLQPFQERLELSARHNLERRIDELSSGLP